MVCTGLREIDLGGGTKDECPSYSSVHSRRNGIELCWITLRNSHDGLIVLMCQEVPDLLVESKRKYLGGQYEPLDVWCLP